MTDQRAKGKRILDEESSHNMAQNSENIEVSSYVPSSVSRGKKPKKLTSKFWDHFKLVCDENGSKWAVCIYCAYQLPIDTSKTGTNPLKRHLERHCKNYDSQKGINLVDLTSGKGVEGSGLLDVFKFNQERSKRDLVEAIIVHEYPFSIVTHVFFKKLIHNLQPSFKFMSRQTIARECMRVYDDESVITYDSLKTNTSRVSITSDIWTSLQNFSYMVITVHYIDSDWKLQKWIINFCKLESRHAGEDIARLIYENCCYWNIERNLFGIVLDNFSANDVAVSLLKDNLCSRGFLLGDGKFLHGRCSAHVLNLIVQDGLREIGSVIEKLCEGVKYVRKSTQKWEVFSRHAEQLGAPNKKLVVDVSTRWNSTFLMLKVALEFKQVFIRYASIDKKFKFLLSEEEWGLVEMMMDCLEIFYEMTVAFSCTKSPTCNMFIVKICELRELLDAWCIEEGFIGLMATNMREKFNKYWDKIPKALEIASVLDPRFKLKALEIYYLLIHKEEKVLKKLKKVQTTLSNLVNEYGSQMPTSIDLAPSQGNIASDVSPGFGRRGKKRCMTWQSRLKENIEGCSSVKKTELELYIEEPVLQDLNHDDFDVLVW